MKLNKIGQFLVIFGFLLFLGGGAVFVKNSFFSDSFNDNLNNNSTNENSNNSDDLQKKEEENCISAIQNTDLIKIDFLGNDFSLKVPFISCVNSKIDEENHKIYVSSNEVYTIDITVVEEDVKTYYEDLYSSYQSNKSYKDYSIKVNNIVTFNGYIYYLISVVNPDSSSSFYNIVMKKDNDSSFLITIEYELGVLEAGFIDEILNGIEYNKI